MGVHIVSTLAAAGLPVDVPAFTLLLVAALMVLLGNYLSKSRSMFRQMRVSGRSFAL